MHARRPLHHSFLCALTASLVLALAGCGGGDDDGVADSPDTGAPAVSEPAVPDDGPEAEPEPADGDAVLVQGFRFQPSDLTVAPGATVTWTNEDDIRHTATSGAPGAPDGTFAVSLDGKGATGSFTFADAGTYAYYCEVHESMLGTVVVSG
jgi:plastocyanin